MCNKNPGVFSFIRYPLNQNTYTYLLLPPSRTIGYVKHKPKQNCSKKAKTQAILSIYGKNGNRNCPMISIYILNL